MPPRLSICVYLSSAFLFGIPRSVTAQNEPSSPIRVNEPSVMPLPRPASVDSNVYERRALRFESHHGSVTILEGADGAVVGKTEWFKRFDLASLVGSSERAVAEAGGFNRNRRVGEWALAAGFLVFAADAIVLKATGDGPNAASTIAALGATAIMIYGLERLAKANEALSKSLWWYNRDLTK